MSSSSGSSRGLTFKLHPLAIVNISDHYTRLKSQSQCSASPANARNGGAPVHPPRVFGCVIGVQRGRTVEIFNSFALVHDPVTDSLDRSFLLKKLELYKKVFPDFYILGWYSTGSEVQGSDMQIHKALMDINESPVHVLLNPTINHSQKDLPVDIYESELHVIDGTSQLIFVRSNYTIENVGAERISVDHVTHLKHSDGRSAATQLAANLTGDIPHDNSLLRQISSLLRRFPVIESVKFQELLMEYNDTLLMTYLAMFTNCSSTMNEMVDKFDTAYNEQSIRGGTECCYVLNGKRSRKVIGP